MKHPSRVLRDRAAVAFTPARRWEVLRLPSIGPHFLVPVPGRRRSVSVGEEPRSALIGHLDTPRGPLAVACTHLSFLPGWNVIQLRRIARHLHSISGPAAIMGDLNLPAGLPAGMTAFRSLASEKTYPSHRPLMQLYHIVARDLGLVDHTAAVRLPLSDHRALVVRAA